MHSQAVSREEEDHSADRNVKYTHHEFAVCREQTVKSPLVRHHGCSIELHQIRHSADSTIAEREEVRTSAEHRSTEVDVYTTGTGNALARS